MLKLVLNIYEPQSEQDASEKFVGAARILFECALGHAMPGEAEHLLVSETAAMLRLHGKEVVVAKEPWPGHRMGGYEVSFIIRNSEAPQPGASGRGGPGLS